MGRYGEISGDMGDMGGAREATARYGEIWEVRARPRRVRQRQEVRAALRFLFVGVLEMTVEDCTAAAAAADAAAGDGGPCQQRLERHLAAATAARAPSLVLLRGAERCDSDRCFDAALGILERREIARDCPRLPEIVWDTGDRSKRVRPRIATD